MRLLFTVLFIIVGHFISITQILYPHRFFFEGDKKYLVQMQAKVSCQGCTKFSKNKASNAVNAEGKENAPLSLAVEITKAWCDDPLFARNGYKIVLPQRCIILSGPGVKVVITKEDNMGQAVGFQINRDGKSKISLAVSVVKNGAPASCGKEPLVIGFEVEGLVDEEKELWVTFENQGFNGWCEFYKRYNKQRFATEALKLINGEIAIKWRKIKDTASVKTLDAFIAKYKSCQPGNKWVLAADSTAEGLKAREAAFLKAQADEEKAINSARNSGDMDLYQVYLRQYTNEGRFAQEAFDSIRRLQPINRYMTEQSDGWMVLQFDPLVKPGYKDISLQQGLDIDDSRFAKEKILKVRPEKTGNFTIEVRDLAFPWKSLKVEFSNKFRVHFAFDSTHATFTMIGGAPPYHIALRDMSSDSIVWHKTVQDTVFVLNIRQELQRKNIHGIFQPQVSDASSEQSFRILQRIVVHPPKKISKRIATLDLVILSSALILLLFLIILRKKRPRKTIFDDRAPQS